MRTVHTSIAALLILAACDAAEDPDQPSSSATGKADGVDADAPTAGYTYFVFTNGVFCAKAPCPSVTAVGPDGTRQQISNVIFPTVHPDEDVDASEGLRGGGVAVTGEIIEGSSDPGEPGNVFKVEEVVGFAQEHLVVRKLETCFAAPCPTHAVFSDDGSERELSGVDVILSAFSSENEAEVASDILNSRVTAIGWVREGSWDPGEPGNVLITSLLVAGVQNYEFRSSGVDCFHAPCPAWEAEDDNGTVTEVADFLDTGLLPREEQLEPLMSGGSVTVNGWISEGDWTHPGPGNVLHIIDFAE